MVSAHKFRLGVISCYLADNSTRKEKKHNPQQMDGVVDGST